MNIPDDKLLWMYRKMLQIRHFEERVAVEFEAGNIPGMVHLSTGQEAMAAGTCAALRPDDYIVSTYRGHGHNLAKGGSPARMMAELFARETGDCHGRGGCLHITDFGVGNLGSMGIVGAGIVLAPGAALSAVLRGTDQVTVCFFGDGASNQGMFHEGLNLAALWKLPVIFVCENNLYGEATPQAEHQPIKDIAERAASYAMPGVVVDGNDVLAVHQAVWEAVGRARAGHGPTLIEGKTYRWHGHYVGDPETYRTREEVAAWKAKDPIPRLRAYLLARGLLDEAAVARMDEEVQAEIEEAVAFAAASPYPDPAEVCRDTFAPEPPSAPPQPLPSETVLTTAQVALREALAEELSRDPRVFLLGEDLRQAIFGVCNELYEEFGPERVRNTPISENAIIGCAVGAALTGMRPVAEIMFEDFLLCCMDPIVNSAAKLRYMTGGQVTVPLVIRVPGGAGLSAGAQHSQSLEALFWHIPGLKVVAPSTPADMKGLLKTAIRDDNPVIFFEHKALYFEGGELPVGEYTIPLGVADVKRPGTDVTIVAFMAMVPRALSAAETLAAEDISVEVVDPRTLVPLDMETILASVRKTKRLLTVEEGALTGGLGAEIAARVAKEAFDYLDAPIERLAGRDCPIPFSPLLEEAMYPSEEQIVATVKQLLGRE